MPWSWQIVAAVSISSHSACKPFFNTTLPSFTSRSVTAAASCTELLLIVLFIESLWLGRWNAACAGFIQTQPRSEQQHLEPIGPQLGLLLIAKPKLKVVISL